MDLSRNTVCIVRSSEFSTDQRTARMTKYLEKRGALVSLVGLNRSGLLQSSENINGVEIHRMSLLKNGRLPSGKPLLAPFLAIWMAWVVATLVKKKPALLMASDFDSMIPCILFCLATKTPLIYHPYDFYADNLQKPVPKYVITAARLLERRLAKHAIAMVLPDISRIQQYGNANLPSRIVEIVNSPDDVVDSRSQFQAIGSGENGLEIFYGGLLTRSRGLFDLIEVVRREEGLHLTIAGFGEDKEELVHVINHHRNTTFVGEIGHDEIMRRTQQCDLVIALYDPRIPNNKFASPNKLFEAMACGRPIVVNDGTRLADLVTSFECGLTVEYGNLDSISSAILTLRDDLGLRERLGRNGRTAFEANYRWTTMEERLDNLFKDL